MFIIQVPVGTFFRDENGSVIADLKAPGDQYVAVRGGAGGKGNYFFLSNENRAPTTYEEGGKGEEKVFYAEMRVIADFGMVCKLNSYSFLSDIDEGFADCRTVKGHNRLGFWGSCTFSLERIS